MTVPLVFREITSISDPLLPSFLDAYETCFPPNEREPVSKLVKILLAITQAAGHSKHSLVGEESGRLIVMAQYSVLADKAMAYLAYMAVADRSRRGNGLGTVTFNEVIRRMQTGSRGVSGIILEIDDPDKYDAKDPEKGVATRRIDFYRRLGVRLLSGVHYNQTVEFFPEGTQMKIGVFPIASVTPQWVYERARYLFGADVEICGDLTLI